jgi:hypothetical protein
MAAFMTSVTVRDDTLGWRPRRMPAGARERILNHLPGAEDGHAHVGHSQS